MNKEVIYLEPEDDITDILSKLQRAEQKLVALVPPKKATMLRSAVNMKLVARAAKECKKIVVVVTADPALAKLAMTAQIPVAKTLQSRPVIPTKESIAAAAAGEQVIDEDLAEKDAKTAPNDEKSQKDHARMAAEGSHSASERTSGGKAETIDLSEESLENGQKDAKKSPKKGKDGKKVPDMARYRRWIILGVAAALILVVLGVWAFVFAPAVKITVAMSTSANNFSEEISFTTDGNAADPAMGVFYAEKQTYEPLFSEEFEATGKDDHGEKATGTLTVTVKLPAQSSYISQGYTYTIDRGTRFTASASDRSVTYRATETVTVLSWDGKDTDQLGTCKNSITSACIKSGVTIHVEAENAGSEYNIPAGRTWNTINDGDVTISASNTAAFAGGSSKEVTVVTQSNVDSAANQILSNHQVEGREVLMSQINRNNVVVIDSSFSSEAVDVKADPGVDAEVDANTKPKISLKAVYSVYTVSRDQIEEYIKAKMNVADDQRIYSVGDPYFERFTNIEESARVKTVVKTGPTVTEEAIIDKAKGRKIGEVQALLRSINGVSSVTIDPSFFWVRTVPDAAEKITVELTVEDN